MSHICHAGCTKLVIMSDGRIIPCEAFKGLVDYLPELVLGTIKEPNCLELALERAKAITWLTCFQEEKRQGHPLAPMSDEVLLQILEVRKRVQRAREAAQAVRCLEPEETA